MSKASFEHLFSPHIKSLYKIAYQWTLNSEDAEDLIQDLALKLVGRVDEMANVEVLHPWLVRVMYRLFVDEFRRKQARPLAYEHQFTGDIIARLVDNNSSNPETRSIQEQLGKQLLIALTKLEKEQAVALFMFEVEGYSLKEIAKIQDVSEGTVKSRLHRSRKTLQKYLKKGTFIDGNPC